MPKQNVIRRYLTILLSLSGVVLMGQNCSDLNFSESHSSFEASCLKENGEIQKVSITGPSTVEVNKTTSFKLENINDCSNIQSISWKSSDGYKISPDYQTEFRHSYRNPGEYALEAVLIDNNGEHSRIIKPLYANDSCKDGESCIQLQGPELLALEEVAQFNVEGLSDDEDAEVSLVYSNESDSNVFSPQSSISFSQPGAHTLDVYINEVKRDSKSVLISDKLLVHKENGTACSLKEVVLSGASKAHLDEPLKLNVQIPDCLKSHVEGVKWAFSDSQPYKYSQYIETSFSSSGDQSYQVDLLLKEGSLRLSRDIKISEDTCEDCVFNSETQTQERFLSSETGSSHTGKVVQDQPVFVGDEPVSDNSNSGDDNSSEGESPKPPVVVDEPLNKSCGDVAHGDSIVVETLYEGEQTVCDGGGNKIVYRSSDRIKTCNNGSFEESIVPGDSTKSSSCYKWTKVDETQCTEACGGLKSDILACVGEDGSQKTGLDAQICGAKPDTPKYACDGDPNFEKVEVSEDINKGEESELAQCSKNMSGYIITKTTTQDIYRCKNHEIVLDDTVETKESSPFCLKLKRCSHDSLNPKQSKGRLAWMNKCRSNSQKIDTFMEITDNFEKAPQNTDDIRRTTYITFIDESNGEPWLAPKSDKASCDIPEAAEIAGICTSSCVTPSQRILASAGWSRMDRALEKALPEVATLAPHSTVLKPVLTKTPVMQFVTELVDSNHDVIKFTLASGNTIEYTPNHPVLTADGELKYAGDFIVSEHFVKKDGSLDEIVNIKSFKHYGKVYNLYNQSSANERNIVVINDYLTGTAYFQNEGEDFVNRKILRDRLTKN